MPIKTNSRSFSGAVIISMSLDFVMLTHCKYTINGSICSHHLSQMFAANSVGAAFVILIVLCR